MPPANDLTPPERFPLTARPGHDVHWLLAAELVKVIWAKHNASFAATVRDFYGRPAKDTDDDAQEPEFAAQNGHPL